MKKIEFNFKNLELVKGCPTDINGNGQEDDDYNNDGYVDEYDQNYYDGYTAGYGDDSCIADDFLDNPEGFNAGWNDGFFDGFGDNVHEGQEGNIPGPDVNGEDFQAPTGY